MASLANQLAYPLLYPRHMQDLSRKSEISVFLPEKEHSVRRRCKKKGKFSPVIYVIILYCGKLIKPYM